MSQKATLHQPDEFTDELEVDLLATYDDWKGSNKLVSCSMHNHMKQLIQRDYPWLLIGYLKKNSPNEVT
jgi:hypothetical protein